jgi:hypothetical protein
MVRGSLGVVLVVIWFVYYGGVWLEMVWAGLEAGKWRGAQLTTLSTVKVKRYGLKHSIYFLFSNGYSGELSEHLFFTFSHPLLQNLLRQDAILSVPARRPYP